MPGESIKVMHLRQKQYRFILQDSKGDCLNVPDSLLGQNINYGELL